jgi:putative transposase
MTDTIGPVPARIDQQQLAQDLVEAARAEGVELVGPGGLLTGLTKTVLETALDAEMSEHLGYDKHDAVGRDGGNSRNGTRTKTVLTEIGPVEIEVPRDRHSSFEPVIVKKRQRRLEGIDEIVLSLTARGLTTGEVAAHFEEVYGAKISRDTISRITDKVIEEMTEWQNRPLDAGRSPVVVANQWRPAVARKCRMTSSGVRSERTRRGRRLSSRATRVRT